MIKNGEEGKQELARLYHSRRRLMKGTSILEEVYFTLNLNDSPFACKEKTKKVFKRLSSKVGRKYDEEREEIWACLFYLTGNEK